MVKKIYSDAYILNGVCNLALPTTSLPSGDTSAKDLPSIFGDCVMFPFAFSNWCKLYKLG